MAKSKSQKQKSPAKKNVRPHKNRKLVKHVPFRTKAVIATQKRIESTCLSLPESGMQPFGEHLTFRVRKKVFAYFLNNHHSDGIVSVCCKVPKGKNQQLAAKEPSRYYIPAYIGHQGWVGIRLDVDPVNWGEIESYISLSYCLTAPSTLINELE